MVEHLLAKEKAAGSNPVFRSIPLLSFPIPSQHRIRRVLIHVWHDPFGGVGSDLTL